MRMVIRRTLYLLLLLLYILHNDLWLWYDRSMLFGFPVGLTYHLGYCILASLLFAMLVRKTWPDALPEGES